MHADQFLFRHPRRIAAALIALTLAAATAVLWTHTSPGWWVLLLFGLGPDIAGLLSIERGLDRGQMSPRAVPVYNLLHRPVVPIVLGGLAAASLVPAALLVGALVWGFHIALDRTLGYGLRTPDGRQR